MTDSAGRGARRVFEAVQHDFAEATQVVFYAMAGVMVVCYVVAHVWMPRDKPAETVSSSA